MRKQSKNLKDGIKNLLDRRGNFFYNKVIDYLIEYWTEKEVLKFTDALTKKLGLISSGNVTFKSSVKKSYHEILITKHNLLI